MRSSGDVERRRKEETPGPGTFFSQPPRFKLLTIYRWMQTELAA